MKYARKVMPVIDAKALDGDLGLVEAYCSVFNNIDFAGETIRPGAFADTISDAVTGVKDYPAVLWSHDMWEQPLGITKEAEEVLPYDSRLPKSITSLGGLRVVGQFNLDTQAGHDAFSNIKMGALRKYSIGYYVLVEQFDRETGVIELLKLDWLEWSPVNFAANDATLTVGAKGARKVQTDEHLYVLRQPSDFVENTYRREQRTTKSGKAYTVVTGKLRATGSTEEASIRYDADAWSAQDARSFSHNNGKGTFECATKSEQQSEGGSERLADHGARVVAQVSDYLERVQVVAETRKSEGKAGRVLSEANRNILKGLVPDLVSVTDRVQGLLDATDTEKSATDDKDVGTKQSEDNGRKFAGQIFAMQAQLLEQGMEIAS